MVSHEFKEKLSVAAAILRWELGNMWGHVSIRLPEKDRFLLMHLRPPEDASLPPDEVLEYDLKGNLISGRREQPDEIFFYACPYEAKDDVEAVIHCHPEMAIALTAAGQEIVPIHLGSRNFTKVPVAPWLYGFWREHGEQACQSMGQSSSLMIQGHGALVTGISLEQTCINMVQLERTAKMLLMTGPFGKPLRLPAIAETDMRAVESHRAKDKTRISQARVPLEWRYYESLINKGERWSRL